MMSAPSWPGLLARCAETLRPALVSTAQQLTDTLPARQLTAGLSSQLQSAATALGGDEVLRLRLTRSLEPCIGVVCSVIERGFARVPCSHTRHDHDKETHGDGSDTGTVKNGNGGAERELPALLLQCLRFIANLCADNPSARSAALQAGVVPALVTAGRRICCASMPADPRGALSPGAGGLDKRPVGEAKNGQPATHTTPTVCTPRLVATWFGAVGNLATDTPAVARAMHGARVVPLLCLVLLYVMRLGRAADSSSPSEGKQHPRGPTGLSQQDRQSQGPGGAQRQQGTESQEGVTHTPWPRHPCSAVYVGGGAVHQEGAIRAAPLGDACLLPVNMFLRCLDNLLENKQVEWAAIHTPQDAVNCSLWPSQLLMRALYLLLRGVRACVAEWDTALHCDLLAALQDTTSTLCPAMCEPYPLRGATDDQQSQGRSTPQQQCGPVGRGTGPAGWTSDDGWDREDTENVASSALDVLRAVHVAVTQQWVTVWRWVQAGVPDGHIASRDGGTPENHWCGDDAHRHTVGRSPGDNASQNSAQTPDGAPGLTKDSSQLSSSRQLSRHLQSVCAHVRRRIHAVHSTAASDTRTRMACAIRLSAVHLFATLCACIEAGDKTCKSHALGLILSLPTLAQKAFASQTTGSGSQSHGHGTGASMASRPGETGGENKHNDNHCDDNGEGKHSVDSDDECTPSVHDRRNMRWSHLSLGEWLVPALWDLALDTVADTVERTFCSSSGSQPHLTTRSLFTAERLSSANDDASVTNTNHKVLGNDNSHRKSSSDASCSVQGVPSVVSPSRVHANDACPVRDTPTVGFDVVVNVLVGISSNPLVAVRVTSPPSALQTGTQQTTHPSCTQTPPNGNHNYIAAFLSQLAACLAPWVATQRAAPRPHPHLHLWQNAVHACFLVLANAARDEPSRCALLAVVAPPPPDMVLAAATASPPDSPSSLHGESHPPCGHKDESHPPCEHEDSSQLTPDRRSPRTNPAPPCCKGPNSKLLQAGIDRLDTAAQALAALLTGEEGEPANYSVVEWHIEAAHSAAALTRHLMMCDAVARCSGALTRQGGQAHRLWRVIDRLTRLCYAVNTTAGSHLQGVSRGLDVQDSARKTTPVTSNTTSLDPGKTRSLDPIKRLRGMISLLEQRCRRFSQLRVTLLVCWRLLLAACLKPEARPAQPHTPGLTHSGNGDSKQKRECQSPTSSVQCTQEQGDKHVLELEEQEQACPRSVVRWAVLKDCPPWSAEHITTTFEHHAQQSRFSYHQQEGNESDIFGKSSPQDSIDLRSAVPISQWQADVLQSAVAAPEWLARYLPGAGRRGCATTTHTHTEQAPWHEGGLFMQLTALLSGIAEHRELSRTPPPPRNTSTPADPSHTSLHSSAAHSTPLWFQQSLSTQAAAVLNDPTQWPAVWNGCLVSKLEQAEAVRFLLFWTRLVRAPKRAVGDSHRETDTRNDLETACCSQERDSTQNDLGTACTGECDDTEGQVGLQSALSVLSSGPHADLMVAAVLRSLATVCVSAEFGRFHGAVAMYLCAACRLDHSNHASTHTHTRPLAAMLEGHPVTEGTSNTTTIMAPQCATEPSGCRLAASAWCAVVTQLLRSDVPHGGSMTPFVAELGMHTSALVGVVVPGPAGEGCGSGMDRPDPDQQSPQSPHTDSPTQSHESKSAVDRQNVLVSIYRATMDKMKLLRSESKEDSYNSSLQQSSLQSFGGGSGSMGGVQMSTVSASGATVQLDAEAQVRVREAVRLMQGQ